MRYEIKFILNSIEFDKFKTWLLINTGFVKKYEPRLVNSIYFDDLNNSSANDNLAGIGIREKYRLRWYNKDFSHLAKFELKRRHNRLNYKKYFDFIPREYQKLETKNSDFAKFFQRQLFYSDKKYFFDLFPKLQVQYKRDYYEDPNNIRLTFDEQIKFWPSFENHSLFFGSSLPYDLKIIEIKFSIDRYSLVSELLRKTNFLPKRHSKYLAGLAVLNEFKYI